MIKAIIFDFGSVIYKTKWKELDEFFSKKNGFSVLIANSNDDELIRIYRDSDVGKEDFRKFFLRINPNVADINKVLEDYKEGYSKYKILNGELLKIIKDLRKRGFRLFGFTDIKKEHYEANLKLGVYDGFEEIFTSFEFNHLKSEKKSFDRLAKELKRYGLNPSECVFVDDRLENVENARKIGMKAIHYAEFPDVGLFKAKLEEVLS